MNYFKYFSKLMYLLAHTRWFNCLPKLCPTRVKSLKLIPFATRASIKLANLSATFKSHLNYFLKDEFGFPYKIQRTIGTRAFAI